MDERAEWHDRERCPLVTQQPAEPAPWVDLTFWMLAGFFVGAFTPTAACAFLSAGGATGAGLVVGVWLAPPASILGAMIGLFFGWGRPRRGPVTADPPASGFRVCRRVGVVSGALAGILVGILVALVVTFDDPSPTGCALVLLIPAAATPGGAVLGGIIGTWFAWGRTEPLADPLFWMVAGLLIGGLSPTAACYFTPPGADTYLCLSAARKYVPPVALLGGIIGLSYGWARARRRRPAGGAFAGAWREKAEAARGKFRDVIRPTGEEGITPGCPDEGASSADTFSPKPPPG